MLAFSSYLAPGSGAHLVSKSTRNSTRPLISQISRFSRSRSRSTKATQSSDERRIHQQILELGHRRWGFVIYRCTYEDDAAWGRFMDIANARAREDLSPDESDLPELLHSLEWKVFDDRKMFNHASKDQVRRHFLSWCASTEAKTEQYGPSPPPWVDTMQHLSPRYSFCLQVDAEALNSVVHKAPQPPELDSSGVGWVALIDANWELPDPDTFDYEDNGMDPRIHDPTDEGEVPVEGCKLYDIGWTRMGAQSMGVSAYSALTNPANWVHLYRRPPAVWTR